MRVSSSLLLAGAVGLGSPFVTPATAEAQGGWRGFNHYGYYGAAAAPPSFFRAPATVAPRVLAPRARVRSPGFFPGGAFGVPPTVLYPISPGFFPPFPSFYGAPGGVFGVPFSYGVPPGPAVGLFGGIPPFSYGVRPGPAVGLFTR